MFETPRRLKRVYVSNPLVIDSFTASPTQIVVTAKAPGISSLILWDEAGQSQTYLVSSDTDVANLQQEIHAAMPNDDIRVESQQDRISLSGTAWTMLHPRRPLSWPVSTPRRWLTRS